MVLGAGEFSDERGTPVDFSLAACACGPPRERPLYRPVVRKAGWEGVGKYRSQVFRAHILGEAPFIPHIHALQDRAKLHSASASLNDAEGESDPLSVAHLVSERATTGGHNRSQV